MTSQELERWEQVKKYWQQLRAEIAANRHRALELYLQTPRNLSGLLDEAVLGEEKLTLDPRFYRPRIELDEPPADLEVTEVGDEERTFISSRPNPDGSVSMTVRPGRTDPPLDAADYEPQGRDPWTLRYGLERLAVVIRKLGV